MAERKTFAEALAETSAFGDNLSVTDVLNKPLTVLDFELLDTQWGEAAKILAIVDGENQSILTWSTVLINQLKRVADLLPLDGAIVKEKNYYTFR